MRFITEIVKGKCPHCEQETVLVSLGHSFKCTLCRSDLEQKVNGHIRYIPMNLGKNTKMILKTDYWDDGA